MPSTCCWFFGPRVRIEMTSRSSGDWRGGRPVILIVQQHQDSRDMYVDFLQTHGFATLETADGDTALGLATDADLVVTDNRLSGGLDGLTLIARLRGATSTADIPIIVVAAHAFSGDRADARATGCDAFLPMPCLP